VCFKTMAAQLGDHDYYTVQEYAESGLHPFTFANELAQMKLLDNRLFDYCKEYYNICPDNQKGKRCFNYLLSDPRSLDMENLKAKYRDREVSALSTILERVFYVGKGQGDRPYEHLRDARAHRQQHPHHDAPDLKTAAILQMWDQGGEVEVIFLNSNLCSAESSIREAAMIMALGGPNNSPTHYCLTNDYNGHFPGHLHGWSDEEKKKLGTYMVWKAIPKILKNRGRSLGILDA
jgi:hypothetical protein